MNAWKSLLAVTVLAGTVITPLVSQQYNRNATSNRDSTNGQIQATITNVDQATATITLQATGDQGQSAAQTTLTYHPTHPAALTMYKVGDVVWALMEGSGNAEPLMIVYSAPEGTPYAQGGQYSQNQQYGQSSQYNDTSANAYRFQTEATITNIDKNTGGMTIETTSVPGHPGGHMSLEYKLTHLAGLTLYHNGDKVLADIIVTDNGPKVQSIASR